jgi:hypothetical protein
MCAVEGGELKFRRWEVSRCVLCEYWQTGMSALHGGGFLMLYFGCAEAIGSWGGCGERLGVRRILRRARGRIEAGDRE